MHNTYQVENILQNNSVVRYEIILIKLFEIVGIGWKILPNQMIR